MDAAPAAVLTTGLAVSHPFLTETPPPAPAADHPWAGFAHGLFWIRFGVCWLAVLPLFAFVWAVLDVAVGPFRDRPGLLGFQATAEDEFRVFALGMPLFTGALGLTVGRWLCGRLPPVVGTGGLYRSAAVASGVAAVVGLSALAATPDAASARPLAAGAVIAGVLAEVWFLVAVAMTIPVVGLPWAARAVRHFALAVGYFTAAAATWAVVSGFVKVDARAVAAGFGVLALGGAWTYIDFVRVVGHAARYAPADRPDLPPE
jgi:hypothetical protein